MKKRKVEDFCAWKREVAKERKRMKREEKGCRTREKSKEEDRKPSEDKADMERKQISEAVCWAVSRSESDGSLGFKCFSKRGED